MTDRFISEVDELRRSVEGDAKRLIEQLEGRAVAKFQTRNIETMREFFEREGYLDEREPLSMEIIRRQIIAEQSVAGSGAHLSLAEVDRLLARVGAGAGLPIQSRRQPPSPQPLLWPDPPA